MDNLTHGLLGYAVYAGLKKDWMHRHKKWYAASAILGAEISDLDAWTFYNQDTYLRIHRGITHSALFTPIMSLFAVAILYALCRKRTEVSWKWMYGLAFLGVVTHWFFDWCNTWGTGLFEPFVHERYSLGFLPIIDPTLLLLFTLGLYIRRRVGTKKAFTYVWGVTAIYLLLQAGQNEWIRAEASKQYDQTVVAAGFVPSLYTVIGRKGEDFEIYTKSLFFEGPITRISSNSDPLVVEKVLSDPKAQTIAWFSPFYAITLDKGDQYAIIFDPRFYRNGQSFVKAVIDLAGD